MRKTHKIGGTNIFLTVLLFLGCITVLFPLYMTVMIAFKNPSEMTNDVAGALSFPSSWSLSNFSEAMRVTNFWHSLGNSFLITAVTIVLAVLLHSMAGYAIGRNMNRKKGYKLVYFYIVSGMFVPFAILMMPLVKQTAMMGLDNRLGVIILYLVFYMPMNVMLYSGYLKNVPLAMEEGSKHRRRLYLEDLLDHHFPHDEAHARNRGSSDGSGYLERRYDTAGYHVQQRRYHPAAGTAELPDTVRHQLQPGICLLSAGTDPDSDLLYLLSEADHRRHCKRRSQRLSRYRYYRQHRTKPA